MKTLYLLRHAKAEAGGPQMADEQRALSARGREACLGIGAHMRERSYIPALALCSPSARTRETLARVLEASDAKPSVRFMQSLYLAGEQDIVRAIRTAGGSASSLMVIGHNPGMHHAALALAARRPTPLRDALELKYPTGALTVLRFACNDWQEMVPGEGEIRDFVTPKSW